MDWWGKPDHMKPKGDAPKGKKKRRATKTTKKVNPLWRVTKHSFIIGVLIVVGAVASHFILQLITRHGAHYTVPQFQMLTIEEAQRIAQQGELKLIINDSLYAPDSPRGVILDQLPEQNTVVKPGRSIYLTINATQQKMVDMPYVAGRSLRQAKNMLDIAGLTIERLKYEEDLATNYILSQWYDDMEVKEDSLFLIPAGSGITLHVGLGNGEHTTTTPYLLGRSLIAAKSALWDAGLNVGDIEMERGIEASNLKSTLVLFQSTPADSLLRYGDRVSISLTLHPERVDSVINAIEEERKLMELIQLREVEIADSLRLVAIESGIEIEEEDVEDSVEVVAPQVVERVEFEDLFN